MNGVTKDVQPKNMESDDIDIITPGVRHSGVNIPATMFEKMSFSDENRLLDGDPSSMVSQGGEYIQLQGVERVLLV